MHELLEFFRKRTGRQCEADYFVLLIRLSVVTVPAAMSSGDCYKFPDGFKLGSATASYQIEGGWIEDGKSEQQDTNLRSDLVHSNTEILQTKILFLISQGIQRAYFIKRIDLLQ
jgi:hypothetical protein